MSTATAPATDPVTARLVRRVRVTQLVGSSSDGAVLAVAVLWFSVHVGIPAATVGAVLAVAASCALAASVPVGVLADRVGLRRAGAVFSGLVAVALTLYALAASTVIYAVGAIAFAVAQAGLMAVRQALVAAAVPPDERLHQRAVLHTLLNGGMGAGTVWGAAALGIGHPGLVVGTFAVGALAAAACAVAFVRLPAPALAVGSLARARRPGLRALGDPRFVGITLLSALLQLTMPLLSVVIPLWVATRTEAPTWVAAAALALNTALVLLLQTTWAGRSGTDATAARSALVAAAALPAACALLGAAGGRDATTASVLVGLGVAVLSVGEIAGGAATWHSAFRTVPAQAQGEYQAVFGMAASLARVVGPAAALPLILAGRETGWLVVGAAMGLAGVALARLSRPHPTPTHPQERTTCRRTR